jgi:hypothetical protein
MSLGRKVWSAGEVLAAADVNGYLMDQTVMVFANASSRSASIPTPSAGMTTFRQDGTVTEVWSGSAWVSANSVGGTILINATNVVNTLAASTATAYTFLSSDQSTVLQFTNAGTVTATVGTATALTSGQRIDVLADGAAGLVLTAGSGVSFAGAGTASTSYAVNQYDAATILCVGSNAYRIIGNITAV